VTSDALPIPDGPLGEDPFPDGARVFVTGGQYRDAWGMVLAKAPDLRPGSVWLRLDHGPEVLVPGYRLTVGPTVAMTWNLP
jgi:hypothetical protein